MRYEGRLFRPPSEGMSYILQVTIGCSHNRCAFCGMYREKQFRMRDINEIREDIELAGKTYRHVDRIFLADGNALAMKTEYLLEIVTLLKATFPECRRIGIYGAPGDVLRKSSKELQQLKEAGLAIVYMGVESGSDRILQAVDKGVTAADMIMAGKKVKESNIKLSVTVISGLGGRRYGQEHPLETAKVINAIDPDYLGLLTLMLEEGTPLYEAHRDGSFETLTPIEIMEETKTLVTQLSLSHCVFRSNHASNYTVFAGTLNEEKALVLKQIDEALAASATFRNEAMRRL